MMGYGWDSGSAAGFWMIGGLLLLVGIVVLVVWAVNSMSRNGRSTPSESPRPTANDILRERFARGEITEQEFEQARKVLGPDR